MSTSLPSGPGRPDEEAGGWPDPGLWKRRKFRRFLATLNLYRRPRVECIRFGYEKAGLAIYDEPIPWNAETALVEAAVWLPQRLGRDVHDFSLRLPDHSPPTAPVLSPLEKVFFRVVFRVPPPRVASVVHLCWRSVPLARVMLPFLSADDFLRRLALNAPAVFVGFKGRYVPCRTMVGGQGRGAIANGTLRSPTRLLPLADLRLRAVFVEWHGGRMWERPVLLNRSQLNDRQAVLIASPPPLPKAIAGLTVRWTVENRLLSSQTIHSVPWRTFKESLRLIDSGYLCEGPDGRTVFRTYLPPRDAIREVAPCFRVASLIPSMTGLCTVEIRTRPTSGGDEPVVLRLEALITDGPSLIAPPLMKPEEFRRAAGFDLVCDGKVLGSLAACPRPAATFTSEGSFQMTSEGDWLPVDEQELVDRLARLRGPEA